MFPFLVDELETHLDILQMEPAEGEGIRVLGRWRGSPPEQSLALQERLGRWGYVLAVRPMEGGLSLVQIMKAPPPTPVRWWVHVGLFLATVLTTLWVGAFHLGHDPWREGWTALRYGIPFSFSLLLILGAHEMGHFLTARRWRVDTSPPYFIPFPNPLIGTMGAFIRMRSPVPHGRALMDIAAAGPWAGMAAALPVLWIGMLLSPVVPTGTTGTGLFLGENLFFKLMVFLTHGPLPPGTDIQLHPVAFAGWLGLFVTAINLLPVGQLDGGHILYALWPQRQRWFGMGTLLFLLLMGKFWSGWWTWAFLVLILGIYHPPTLNPLVKLDRRRRWVGYASIVLFLITFIPQPFVFRGTP